MVTTVTSTGAFSTGLFSLLLQAPSANANSRQAGTRMRGDVRTSRECIGETSTKAGRQNSRRGAGEAVLFYLSRPDLSITQGNVSACAGFQPLADRGGCVARLCRRDAGSLEASAE